MTDKEQPFRFSELVKLYCENYGVIKTLEDRWKKEMGELVRRLKKKLAKYDKEWNMDFSNTYGWARKRVWGENPPIEYQFLYYREKIGEGKLEQCIHVSTSNRELRERICRDLGKKIKETFESEVEPRSVYVATTDIHVGERSYEEAILQAVEKCIEFAPNLDPYARGERRKKATKTA